MELIVLGRYGPYPRAGGACSGYLVRGGGATLLIDCGAGALGRLLAVCELTKVDAILLSHLHYDHCSDMSVLRYALEQLAARGGVAAPMPVYAPDAPADTHRLLLDHPVFDVRTVKDGLSTAIGGMRVTFHAMRHSVPTFGMDIVADDGKRLFYTGDTAAFDGLAALCAGADALLADTCFTDCDDHGQKLVHMTARQAGKLAVSAGVKRLYCTHLWGGGDTEETVKKEVDIPCATVVQELGRYTI